MDVTDEDLRKMAKARVGFRMHALAYVVVNPLLIAIWWMTSGDRSLSFAGGNDGFWPIWSLMGWGIGLAMHGWSVYGAGKDWEAREYEKLKARYGGKQ